MSVDADKGLIMVKGSVPGSDGKWVLIRDAVKRPRSKDLPFPAALRAVASEEAPAVETAPEEAPAVEAAPAEAPVVEAAPEEAPATTESEG